MPPRTRKKPTPPSPPQPDRPPRNPVFAYMTDEQVWCRAFMHAWYPIRSEDTGFTIAGAPQTRIYFDCGNGCEGRKSLIHDSRSGKRWGQSRSSAACARVGIYPKHEFVLECFARNLLAEFTEQARAAHARTVVAPQFSG